MYPTTTPFSLSPFPSPHPRAVPLGRCLRPPPPRPFPSLPIPVPVPPLSGARLSEAAGGGRPAPLLMAAAGGTRRGALLALLSLLSLLALLALRAGHGGEGRAGSPRLPPGLLEELRQRQRDLRRLAAAEGGQAEGAGLGCGDLRGATGGGVLGSGFTKVVQRAALPGGGGAVALKSVHGAGREVRQCEQRYGAPAGCRRLAAYKLLKEVALLQRLRHPGIVQVRRGDPRLSPPSLLFSSPLTSVSLSPSCAVTASTAAAIPGPGSRPCWSWEPPWR